MPVPVVAKWCGAVRNVLLSAGSSVRATAEAAVCLPGARTCSGLAREQFGWRASVLNAAPCRECWAEHGAKPESSSAWDARLVPVGGWKGWQWGFQRDTEKQAPLPDRD